MKRVSALLLTLLLLLTGCANRSDTKNISVKDVCCPYKIHHRKDAVEITLKNGELGELQWQMETTPEDVCEVVQISEGKDGVSQYRVTGLLEGAAQIRFTALKGEEAIFALSLVVHVDAEVRTRVSSCEHWQREGDSVSAEGLQYAWNVDANGVLHFSFVNGEDRWSVRETEQEVCSLSEKMATPVGCKFSAEAKSVGQADIFLVGETTQRKIIVRIQANDEGKLEVISVQEQ